MSLSIFNFNNPVVGTLVKPDDIPTLQQGMALIDPKNDQIASWMGERKGQLQIIQSVADESLRVNAGLMEASNAHKNAVEQVEISGLEREALGKKEETEEKEFKADQSSIAERLGAVDQQLKVQKQLFSFTNPLYTEFGMRYGPHALTLTAPVMAYVHWDTFAESCRPLALKCAWTFTDQSIFLPLVVAAVATVLFARAAVNSRDMLKEKSRINAELSTREQEHSTKVKEFKGTKERIEDDHKTGLERIKSSKDISDALNERKEQIHGAVIGLQKQILADVYDRNVSQVKGALLKLKEDPSNTYAKEVGVSAMQNVVDLVVTTFAGSKLALEYSQKKDAVLQIGDN